MPGKRIVLVASPGGHRTELLELAEAFAGHETHCFTYAPASSEGFEGLHVFPNLAQKPWTFPVTFFRLFRLLRQLRPVCLMSTGGELAIPAFLIGKFVFRTRLIFIECSAQVQTPSLTGRVLCRFCDLFFVQWRSLLKTYGKRARYAGGLI